MMISFCVDDIVGIGSVVLPDVVDVVTVVEVVAVSVEVLVIAFCCVVVTPGSVPDSGRVLDLIVLSQINLDVKSHRTSRH